MKRKLLFLLTRTPLHAGAGDVVGAIDRPICRERHTGLPVIPGSAIKGAIADCWVQKMWTKDANGREYFQSIKPPEAHWLFGAPSSEKAKSSQGALQFSEAKLLAFPIRSAKGCFGWITSPLLIKRFARDGGYHWFKEDRRPDPEYIPEIEPRDDQAIFAGNTLSMGDKIVLEEYTFYRARESGREVPFPNKLLVEFARILSRDTVWSEAPQRLVILNNQLVSFFTQSACEIAQHGAVDESSGVIQSGGFYTQENVPSDTLFYTVINCTDEAGSDGSRKPDEELRLKMESKNGILQIGADASTGLGYCSVELRHWGT